MKAIKVQFYPNKTQQQVIAKTVGCCRFVYNWALHQKIAFYQSSKKPVGKWTLMSELTKLKKDPATEWLGEVSSQCLQQAIVDLDAAFSHFSARITNSLNLRVSVEQNKVIGFHRGLRLTATAII